MTLRCRWSNPSCGVKNKKAILIPLSVGSPLYNPSINAPSIFPIEPTFSTILYFYIRARETGWNGAEMYIILHHVGVSLKIFHDEQ